MADSARAPILLPAYAHNDYRNARPLLDALEMGYRGVEADVFLQEGELRVGHDRGELRPGRTLESLYLEPLRAWIASRGRLLSDSSPFLLDVELKESDPRAYAALRELLARYRDLLVAVRQGKTEPGPLRVVLVGWQPPVEQLGSEEERLVGIQRRVQAGDRAHAPAPPDLVWLVSLDYGKNVRWRGRGPVAARDSTLLVSLREAKRSNGAVWARVHDVPVDRNIYRWLLDGGVDLIGTKDLRGTRRELEWLVQHGWRDTATTDSVGAAGERR